MNSKTKYLLYTLAFSVLLGLVPTIIFFLNLGHYPVVPAEIIDDKLYYLSRIREVLSGNIFIGNSYLLEHAKDTSMAFFVADWFYAIPFLFLKLLGSDLSFSVVFSEVFWVALTGYLLYKLFNTLEIEEKKSSISVFCVLSSVLFFVLRPVSMAVVYPIFIYFLISYLSWLKKPEGKSELLNLILSSVLSFYVYTYLWQVTFVVLGLTLLLFIYKKNNLFSIIKTIAFSLLLALPVFYYTYKQIINPYYMETLKRVGFVNTHLFGLGAVVYSFVLLSVVVLAYIMWRTNKITENTFIFFGLISVSILGVSLSNVVTGKDLELAVHVGRFADLFIPIFVFYLLFFVFDKNFIKSIAFIFFVFLAVYFVLNIKQTLVYSLSKIDFKSEEYIAVINKLNSLDKSSVIFSNDDLSYFIPVMTKNYVLFSPNAELNIVSDYEIQERYLVSRVFVSLSEDQIKSDFRKYAGVGNAVHIANIINRKVKICIFFNVNCGHEVTSSSLIGDKYFDDMYQRYLVIKSNQKKFLQLYNVNYLVFDKVGDKWTIPNYLKKVWSDRRFEIYAVE